MATTDAVQKKLPTVPTDAPEAYTDPAQQAVDDHVLVPESPLWFDDLCIVADWVGAHVDRLAEGA